MCTYKMSAALLNLVQQVPVSSKFFCWKYQDERIFGCNFLKKNKFNSFRLDKRIKKLLKFQVLDLKIAKKLNKFYKK